MNSAKIAILGATASDAARWVAGLQPRGRRDGRHVECVVDCDPHGVRGGDLSHTFGSTRYAPRRMPWHPFLSPANDDQLGASEDAYATAADP